MAAVHLTKTDFGEKIKTGIALVDFWAEWCGPCKMAAPVIDQLSDEYAGKVLIGKVDVDAEGELAQKFGVMSIPTVILFKDGVELARQVDLPVSKATLTYLRRLEFRLLWLLKILMENIYDVIIIGSGPAGLTAGIYTSRANLKTLIIAGQSGGATDADNGCGKLPGIP